MTQFKYMENVTDRSNHGELLAPNGKPSNLSPELYAYVRTPEFKEFFGDWEKGKGIGHSCVLDGNGEPLVLYRGQWSHEDKPFVNYGDGIYFTPQREAAIGYGLDNDPIPAFVNARKPCKVDFDGDADTEDNDLRRRRATTSSLPPIPTTGRITSTSTSSWTTHRSGESTRSTWRQSFQGTFHFTTNQYT